MITIAARLLAEAEAEDPPEGSGSLPPALDQPVPVEVRHQVSLQLEHRPGHVTSRHTLVTSASKKSI